MGAPAGFSETLLTPSKPFDESEALVEFFILHGT